MNIGSGLQTRGRRRGRKWGCEGKQRWAGSDEESPVPLDVAARSIVHDYTTTRLHHVGTILLRDETSKRLNRSGQATGSIPYFSKSRLSASAISTGPS